MIKRKGISPLIATVLLIAFTIVVGGIISIWITSFTKGQADAQTDKGDKAFTCSGSNFYFSKDDVTVSSGILKVIVTNEGDVNQTDYDVYAILTDDTFLSNTTPTWDPSTLEPGQKAQLIANMSNTSFTSTANISTVTVTLGSSDECAGKSYKVDF